MNGGQVREKYEGGQCYNDPRPGTQGVMCYIKKQGCSHCMMFIFCGQHTLCNITASSGFGTGVPHRPPLHRDRDNEHGDDQGRIIHTWKDIQFALQVGMIKKGSQ